ncbi:hypothetical protein [Gelidibacter gilvus]|uniref:Uncharacterized protein n=1 Tax=Gelidibacter gilvus TaxID=59602 RepID=A0A4Q0XL76_9FLAO|nr:hypothetical protein [Gelidibacter gilvus]RXJ52625.1 hypothetical protein ESZ48_02730 [Gelidibacter gilvus]
MVDYLRLFWRDKVMLEHFVCQEENFTELDTIYGYHTGEIKYPYRTRFNEMEVKITSKYAYVFNSIHKSYNNIHLGVTHNYNDFSYSAICEMIEHINQKLTDITNANLTQFEFGFNLSTPIPAEEIITNNVLMHKAKAPNHNRLFNGRGKLKQFDHHNYVVKIYDKAKQYNLSQNLLRFEIRFQKAVEFQQFGIFKLDHLKDKYKLRLLFLHLMKRFDELIIVDHIDETQIATSDLNRLMIYNNPYYWETTINRYSGTTKMRHLRDYNILLGKYDLLKTKRYLRQLLWDKYLQLINF